MSFVLGGPCWVKSTHIVVAGGESVEEVAARLQKLIERLETLHSAKEILLIAHGDTLSIFWAFMRGRPLGSHREVALQTGELRRFHGTSK